MQRKDKKDGADNSVNEPQLQIDNVTYQQTIPSGLQQQHYYQPLPPSPYFYPDVPQRNLCPWAPDQNTYTNFKSPIYSVLNNYPGSLLNNRSSFQPNYMHSPSECFPSSIPQYRSFLADLECYNCHQKGRLVFSLSYSNFKVLVIFGSMSSW